MDELYYSLVALMEATADRDKAKEEYQGYSWGYAGQQYESTVEEARKRYAEAFKVAVLEVVGK